MKGKYKVPLTIIKIFAAEIKKIVYCTIVDNIFSFLYHIRGIHNKKK